MRLDTGKHPELVEQGFLATLCPKSRRNTDHAQTRIPGAGAGDFLNTSTVVFLALSAQM
jgi:hypothetical protein